MNPTILMYLLAVLVLGTMLLVEFTKVVLECYHDIQHSPYHRRYGKSGRSLLNTLNIVWASWCVSVIFVGEAVVRAVS